MKKLTIIKIGGDVVDNASLLDRFLEKFAHFPGYKLLVHGGGKKATAMARQLSVETKMINGRRITDAQSLDIVTMVYGGLINKSLVAQLQSRGIDALGMSGADLNSIKSHKRKDKEIDFGFVGDFTIRDIRIDRFQLLLENNITPVMCPLTHDRQGQLLNTNADTIASGIATALSKLYDVELIYAFTKTGVLANQDDDSSHISELTLDSYQHLKQQGAIVDGMLPKLKNAFDALQSGIPRVKIKHAMNIDTTLETTLVL